LDDELRRTIRHDSRTTALVPAVTRPPKFLVVARRNVDSVLDSVEHGASPEVVVVVAYVRPFEIDVLGLDVDYLACSETELELHDRHRSVADMRDSLDGVPYIFDRKIWRVCRYPLSEVRFIDG
jgi:hypothetical protein